MQMMYTTDRLSLKLLNENYASMVLDFYQRNRDFFRPYEPQQSNQFYTIAFQESALRADNLLFLRASSLRYYIFEKNKEQNVIGTVSFYHLYHQPYASCKLGYRLDKDAQKNGFAYEALCFLIPKLIQDHKIYRIEADIMPNNISSIKLITKLGFSFEGIARDSCEISGKRENHLRFSLLSTDPLPSFYLKLDR